MHPSPSKPPHKNAPSSSSSNAEEATTLKTIFFFITATLLLMTSISCFATSWVVSALVDWPAGSVVQKRSQSSANDKPKNSKNNFVLFSYLHAALQRQDHCGLQTQSELDKALGIYAKKEVSVIIEQAESKKGKIEMAVQEERNMLQREEDDAKKEIDAKKKHVEDENAASVKLQQENNNKKCILLLQNLLTKTHLHHHHRMPRKRQR